MIKVYKALATVAGIGYIGKGGGTIAAILACALWYLSAPDMGIQLLLISIVLIGGVHVGNQVEKEWGKDSSKVVIDEVAGMFITLVALPMTPGTILTGLVLFRFFDILKPFYIRRAERLRGGWGVMLDDVLAGVYSNIILQVIMYFNQ